MTKMIKHISTLKLKVLALNIIPKALKVNNNIPRKSFFGNMGSSSMADGHAIQNQWGSNIKQH